MLLASFARPGRRQIIKHLHRPRAGLAWLGDYGSSQQYHNLSNCHCGGTPQYQCGMSIFKLRRVFLVWLYRFWTLGVPSISDGKSCSSADIVAMIHQIKFAIPELMKALLRLIARIFVSSELLLTFKNLQHRK